MLVERVAGVRPSGVRGGRQDIVQTADDDDVWSVASTCGMEQSSAFILAKALFDIPAPSVWYVWMVRPPNAAMVAAQG